MKPRLVVRPQVDEDIEQAAAFMFGDNPDAADRFVMACADTIDRIGQSPTLGHQWTPIEPSLWGLRYWTVTGFPNYRVFYVLSARQVDVACVLHSARDLSTVLRGRI